MTKVQYDAWLDALKSRRFVQHKGDLVDTFPDPTAFCCLGVLSTLTQCVGYPDHLLDLARQGHLAILNDDMDCVNYDKVIEELEAHPELYITEVEGG